jgi:hypothetical protein
VGRGRVVETLTEALAALKAEAAENTCRKNLSPSEAVAIGEELWKLERPKAKERQKAVIKERDEKGKAKSTSGKLPEVAKGDVRDKVASAFASRSVSFPAATFFLWGAGSASKARALRRRSSAVRCGTPISSATSATVAEVNPLSPLFLRSFLAPRPLLTPLSSRSNRNALPHRTGSR